MAPICNSDLPGPAGTVAAGGQGPGREIGSGSSRMRAIAPLYARSFIPVPDPLAPLMSSTESDEIGRLYSEESARLERQIARRTGNPAIARDLVHEVFLRVWERTRGVTGAFSGNPSAFLSRSARNAAIDHLRREKVRDSHTSNALPEAAPADPAFAEIAARQSQEAVKRAIRDLPETTRRLFLMNRAEGLTFQEIASRCGMSERNVAKHMAKAVARCARALEDPPADSPAQQRSE
ncbi:RNA polymerase sigma-70 factor, ECF subfamily [Rhodobacter sp. 24-YEA-8]|nr:RNA polymerase sigma-70 factor, ECF subfamily [Rhodobacter sp. 24-YEA-8]